MGWMMMMIMTMVGIMVVVDGDGVVGCHGVSMLNNSISL